MSYWGHPWSSTIKFLSLCVLISPPPLSSVLKDSLSLPLIHHLHLLPSPIQTRKGQRQIDPTNLNKPQTHSSSPWILDEPDIPCATHLSNLVLSPAHHLGAHHCCDLWWDCTHLFLSHTHARHYTHTHTPLHAPKGLWQHRSRWAASDDMLKIKIPVNPLSASVPPTPHSFPSCPLTSSHLFLSISSHRLLTPPVPFAFGAFSLQLYPWRLLLRHYQIN